MPGDELYLSDAAGLTFRVAGEAIVSAYPRARVHLGAETAPDRVGEGLAIAVSVSTAHLKAMPGHVSLGETLAAGAAKPGGLDVSVRDARPSPGRSDPCRVFLWRWRHGGSSPPQQKAPTMTYLFTDAGFATAEQEFLRLTALSVASSIPDEQAALRFQASGQLANLLGLVPTSKHSAAAVIRTIANPAVSTVGGDLVGGLMRVVTYLMTPFT